MQTSHPRHFAAVAALLGLLVATSAAAFDVTGTWEGKASCKGLADGSKLAQKIDITVRMSQDGRDVNLEFQGISFLARASGIAVPSATKPDTGELGFVGCGTRAEPVFGVTARAKVTTKSNGKGAIKFVTIVTGKDLNVLGIVDSAFTCTGSVKRTGTGNPAIGDCPL